MTATVIPINHYPKMTQLALRFPTLQRAEGVDPFNPEQLDAWACKDASHGGQLAAQFVLAVWSGRGARYRFTRRAQDGVSKLFSAKTPWRCGPFDIVDALSTWDVHHREAFATWALKPWYP